MIHETDTARLFERRNEPQMRADTYAAALDRIKWPARAIFAGGLLALAILIFHDAPARWEADAALACQTGAKC